MPVHATTFLARSVLAGLLYFGATAALSAQGVPPVIIGTRGEQAAAAAMNRKLASIVIPSIEFRSTTLGDALEFLRQESVRIDPNPNAAARGVNILLEIPAADASAARPEPSAGAGAPIAAAGAPSPSANTRITLTMRQIPLLVALQYVASQAGLKVKIEPYAVSLVPLSGGNDTLITAVFRVSPDFFGTTITEGVSSGSALDQPATAAH
jgi:general secretion pathway protein D